MLLARCFTEPGTERAALSLLGRVDNPRFNKGKKRQRAGQGGLKERICLKESQDKAMSSSIPEWQRHLDKGESYGFHGIGAVPVCVWDCQFDCTGLYTLGGGG